MDKSAFYNSVRRSLFSGHLSETQVAAIEGIFEAADKFPGPLMLQHLAYALATAYHETGQRMAPVREAFASSDAGAVAALERAWVKGQLKWVKTPYWRPDANGVSWFGRGQVQLTHKVNYQKMSDILDIDLVADPSLALDTAISPIILLEGLLSGRSNRGDFTSFKLEDFINENGIDYVGARKVVNGVDRASDIAGYAAKFETALRQANWADVSEDDEVTEPDRDAEVLHTIEEIRDRLDKLELLYSRN